MTLNCTFILVFFSVYASFSQTTEGLVAKYSFNEGNTFDEVSKTFAKAYHVDLVEDRFGNANNAYYFRGQHGSFINLGTNANIKRKSATISLWVNSHGLMGLGKGVDINPIIWTRSDTAQDCSEAFVMTLDINTKKYGAATNNSCPYGATTYSRNKIDLAKWYHLVLAYNNQHLWFYLNGELQYKIDKNFESKFLEGDSVLIGGYYNLRNLRYFFGCIDDVEIYNRVLTATEIKTLYQAPNPNRLSVILTSIGYALLFLLILVGIVWSIKKYTYSAIKKEKEKNLLVNHAYEQDIKVLKAQMNPHFIFNALNSIQQFILLQENEKAQSYLSKFSKLLRKILVSNTGESISLRDEIEILIGYLEIESLRFNNVFTYEVKVSDRLKDIKVSIPSFLIQPFVENAIWHGLLPKANDRMLIISFDKVNEDTLTCTIDDNGVGRNNKAASEVKETNKSLAIDLVKQRLKLMSTLYKQTYSLEIIDKKDAAGQSQGTKVILLLPIIN